MQQEGSKVPESVRSEFDCYCLRWLSSVSLPPTRSLSLGAPHRLHHSGSWWVSQERAGLRAGEESGWGISSLLLALGFLSLVPQPRGWQWCPCWGKPAGTLGACIYFLSLFLRGETNAIKLRI